MDAKFNQLFVPNVSIHINSSHSNASDTSDDGRGSEDKPFATLLAAFLYATFRYYGNTNVYFYVHDDQVIDNAILGHRANYYQFIAATGVRPTLKLAGSTAFTGGTFGLYDFKIDVSEADNGLQAANMFIPVSLDIGSCEIVGAAGKPLVYVNCRYATALLADGCVLSGPASSAVRAINGASAYFQHQGNITINGEFTHAVAVGQVGADIIVSNTIFSGNATGKRYSLEKGSRILSWTVDMDSTFPGNAAGICDESSTVA